jgi:ubiquinol-cytochrome c reductase cytochrome b/c1 subunit
MHGQDTYIPDNKALAWFERRLPVLGLLNSSFVDYPTPRNLNYWWTFGGILTVVLMVQIITASCW